MKTVFGDLLQNKSPSVNWYSGHGHRGKHWESSVWATVFSLAPSLLSGALLIDAAWLPSLYASCQVIPIFGFYIDEHGNHIYSINCFCGFKLSTHGPFLWLNSDSTVLHTVLLALRGIGRVIQMSIFWFISIILYCCIVHLARDNNNNNNERPRWTFEVCPRVTSTEAILLFHG